DEILDAEGASALGDAREDGGEPDGAGEEDADYRVAGEPGFLAHQRDEQADADAETGHDESDALANDLVVLGAGQHADEQAEPDAGEGAVGQGVARRPCDWR